MRKALVKTYIYELIFLCIYLIVTNKLLEIFEEKFILGVFIILIINVVVFFYLIIYLIILLRSQYYVYKLNLSKSIVMEKKLYKMKKINIIKDIHRINLSAYYRLLNKEEEVLRYLNEVRISRFTLPIVRYCYYMNLAEYKYYNEKKEEARKILEDANSCFQYGEELKLTVKQEIHDYKITSQDHILFVGSGSMPITAFTIAKETGAEITCVDIDKEALDLSKKVAIKLGFPNIIFENELFSLSLDKYSHIIIASLVPLKCEILENIRKTIPVTTKLILRYGNELKELFNYPIYQKEIKTFIKTVIRDRDFIYDTLLLEKETNYGK